MSRPPALVALTALVVAAVATWTWREPPRAEAARPKKPGRGVCGLAFLPLAEGATWTYQSFVPEGFEPPPGLRPVAPETLTVKVVKVVKAADATRVTLEETYRKVTSTAEIVCGKTAVQVPPASFLYNGEPGGGLGIRLDGVQLKGDTFLIKEGLGAAGETMQELVATAGRTVSEGSGATLPSARLELERKMSPKGPEMIETGTGSVSATRVEIQLTGRAALDSQKDKPFNMPTQESIMWFQDGTGLVRVETKTGQGWKLASQTSAGD